MDGKNPESIPMPKMTRGLKDSGINTLLEADRRNMAASGPKGDQRPPLLRMVCKTCQDVVKATDYSVVYESGWVTSHGLCPRCGEECCRISYIRNSPIEKKRCYI